MKKMILGVAACSLLLATSCSEEMLQQSDSQQFTLKVDVGAKSRTYNDGNVCKWSEGDQIFVTSEDGKTSGVLTLISGENTPNATFSGPINGNSFKLKYVVYPVPNKDGEIDMSTLNGNNHNAPMSGDISGNNASFNYACGLVKVEVSGAENLNVSAKIGNTQIAGGTYKFNPKNNTWSFEEGGSVTISVPSSDVVYVPVKAGTTKAEAQITVTIGNINQTYPVEVKDKAISTDMPSIEVDEQGNVNPVSKWDGTVDVSWYKADVKEFTLENASELAGLAKLVNDGNNFAGCTITLDRDIDLCKYNWTPIGSNSSGKYFQGTLDGVNHTIKNLNCEVQQAGVGFFGAIKNGEVKDVVLENAEVSGSKYVGAVVGYVYYGNVINCDVFGVKFIQATRFQGADDKTVGSVVGALFGGKLTECHAENTIVRGHTAVGGILGRVQYGGEVSNNTIQNSIVIQDNSIASNEKNPHYGEIVGQYSSGTMSGNTATDVTVISGVKSLDNKPEIYKKEAEDKYYVFTQEDFKYLVDEGIDEENITFLTL